VCLLGLCSRYLPGRIELHACLIERGRVLASYGNEHRELTRLDLGLSERTVVKAGQLCETRQRIGSGVGGRYLIWSVLMLDQKPNDCLRKEHHLSNVVSRCMWCGF